MLENLFTEVGFAWTVRISGFISLVCCAVATGTITSRHRAQISDKKPIAACINDMKFLLLAIGSGIASFGKDSSHYSHLTQKTQVRK